LETLLQGLVHAKILKGLRGPRGGYQLARERRRITVGEIVRTAMSLSTADPEDLGANSVLLERVIDPAVRFRLKYLSFRRAALGFGFSNCPPNATRSCWSPAIAVLLPNSGPTTSRARRIDTLR
jgi:hypothetical protein